LRAAGGLRVVCDRSAIESGIRILTDPGSRRVGEGRWTIAAASDATVPDVFRNENDFEKVHRFFGYFPVNAAKSIDITDNINPIVIQN
jgi:hypothetical protein